MRTSCAAQPEKGDRGLSTGGFVAQRQGYCGWNNSDHTQLFGGHRFTLSPVRRTKLPEENLPVAYVPSDDYSFLL